MPTIEELMGTALISPNRLRVDMSDIISVLQPSAAPLTVLLSRLQKSEVAKNPKFEWMEDDLLPWFDAIDNATGYDAATTTLKVDNAQYFTEWDIVHVPRTGENMRVTGKDVNNNTITVVRGFGTTAAAPLVDNDPLLILGSAAQEGGLGRKPNIQNPVAVFNYTEIFKTSFGVTRTQQHTAVYGSKELARQAALKGIEHRVAIERAFLFGQKHLAYAPDGQAIRTTAGILSFLTSNVWTVANPVTEQDFNYWLEDLFRYGSKTKYLFASPRWCSTIDGWGRDKLRMLPTDKTYGIAISEYLSTHGRLRVINHPLLEGEIYGGYAIALDLEFVKRRPLEGADTVLQTNIQENDRDGRKDQYLTEIGLELRLPKAHGVAKGLSVT